MHCSLLTERAPTGGVVGTCPVTQAKKAQGGCNGPVIASQASSLKNHQRRKRGTVKTSPLIGPYHLEGAPIISYLDKCKAFVQHMMECEMVGIFAPQGNLKHCSVIIPNFGGAEARSPHH